MRNMLPAFALSLGLLTTGGAALAGPQRAAPKPPKVKVTAVQARKVALAKYPGKVVGKIPLENEEGHWQYAVSIRSGRNLREIMVDANTCKIATVETTTDAKEAAESRSEADKHPSVQKHGGRATVRKAAASSKAPKDRKGVKGEKDERE